MSNIEEIEQALEKLPMQDFVRLAAWVDQRRQQREVLAPNQTDTSRLLLRLLRRYMPSTDVRLAGREVECKRRSPNGSSWG